MIRKKLDKIVEKHGGLILGVDALQPEGHASNYPVLASVSDGEERIIAALRAVWPDAPHLAETIDKTYTWFLRIAACLRYPPSSYNVTNRQE